MVHLYAGSNGDKFLQCGVNCHGTHTVHTDIRKPVQIAESCTIWGRLAPGTILQSLEVWLRYTLHPARHSPL